MTRFCTPIKLHTGQNLALQENIHFTDIVQFQYILSTGSMSSSRLIDRLDSLGLAPTHRIIVGVDYGTTYTGD